MKHLTKLTRPAKAQAKGDVEDFFLVGLIVCVITGECSLGDIKDIFDFLNFFD